jgi:flagellar biosynthetic protein FliR
MNWLTDQFLFNYFLVFCRIGIALGLMPALGGPRYPMMVRLLFALGVALSLTPLVTALHQVPPSGDSEKLRAIFFEIIIGFVIGFWFSCFVYILRFAGSFVVNMIGLAGIPGQPIDEAEPSTPITTILSMALTALIFATGLHLQSLDAMVESYRVFPLGAPLVPQLAGQTTVEVLSRCFYLGLQFSSPFLVFSIIWNFSLGLANRMTPQLSVYFAFSGLLTMASLGVMALVAPKLLYIPLSAYEDFMTSGFR